MRHEIFKWSEKISSKSYYHWYQPLILKLLKRQVLAYSAEGVSPFCTEISLVYLNMKSAPCVVVAVYHEFIVAMVWGSQVNLDLRVYATFFAVQWVHKKYWVNI